MRPLFKLTGDVRPSFWIFLSALTLRFLHLWLWQSGQTHEHWLHDGKYFDALALSFHTGFYDSKLLLAGLTSTYTLFLFFCYSLFGHDLAAVRLVQIVLGALACVGIYQIARDCFGRRAGWIAGGLAAFSGILIYFDSIIAKASMVHSSVVLILWAFHRGLLGRKISAFALSGAAFAVAAISRNNLSMTFPFFILALILAFRQSRSKIFLWGGVAFVAAMSATMITVPQYFQSLLVKTSGAAPIELITAPNGGIHFYIGNHSGANGTYKKVRGVQATTWGHVEDARRIAESTLKRKLTYHESDRFWFEKTLGVIRTHPVEWGRLLLKKLFLVFNAYEIPNASNYDFWRRRSPVLSLPLVSYGLLMPLALLGWFALLRMKDARPTIILLQGFAVSYILSLILTFVTADYRLPLYPVWILFSAFAVDRLLEAIRQNQSQALKQSAWLLLIFFLFCHYETYLDRASYAVKSQKKLQSFSARSVKSPHVSANAAGVL